jgi:hypothetical protein
MSKFDEIEAVLKVERHGVLEKFSDRIKLLESRRPWIVGIGVMGAGVAAFSRIDPTGTVGLVMAIAGGIVAALSGLAFAAFDFKKLEISADLLTAENAAEDAVREGRRIEADLKLIENGATALDARRRERFTAIADMLQQTEAGLIGKHSPAETAERLLRRSIASIRKATDYDAADFFTVTIFQRQTIDDHEVMVRVAVEWTDPQRALAGRRTWKLGFGYTGVAWQRALTNPNGDVIIEDTFTEEAQNQYPVEKRDPAREALYRSVAAIPILTGPENDVWGIVTATSDRVGMFTRSTAHGQVQNVEMIRDIARVAALLAGLP